MVDDIYIYRQRRGFLYMNTVGLVSKVLTSKSMSPCTATSHSKRFVLEQPGLCQCAVNPVPHAASKYWRSHSNPNEPLAGSAPAASRFQPHEWVANRVAFRGRAHGPFKTRTGFCVGCTLCS